MTICNVLDSITNRRIYKHNNARIELNQDEIDFLSIYFRDIVCIRNEFGSVCFMPIEYKELETVSIPSVYVIDAYKNYIKTHKETNRIKRDFLESMWSSNPPWEFSIDKEDLEKVDLVSILKNKGYRVEVLNEDESSLDLKVEI